MAINAGGVIRGAKSLAMGLTSTMKTGSTKATTSAAKSVISKTAASAAVAAVAVPVVKSLVSSVTSSNLYTKADAALGGYLPGGITPTQDNTLDMHGGIARNWSTGTTTMGILRDGNWYAVKKNGMIKVFRPSKNVVFGKKIEPRKFIRIALKYRGIHRELNGVFKSIKIRRK